MSTPLDTLEMAVAERDSIRQQMADLRVEIESNIVETTTNPSREGVEKSVELQKAMMDLMVYFLKIGGRVMAVPVYHINATSYIIRLRTSRICELVWFTKTYPAGEIPHFLVDQVRTPGESITAECHAIKQKDGATKHLIRLIGNANDPAEDTRVWKWLFADLKEHEDMTMKIREKARWGWAGKFVDSDYNLAIGPPAADFGIYGTFSIH